MRAVTGTVVSSKPIPLSKAAKVLYRFAANENAARPEVLAYVRRASAAFVELVQFHREIRAEGNRPELEKSAVNEERKKKRKRSSDDQVADQDGAAPARDGAEIRVNTTLAGGYMNLQRGGAEAEDYGERKKKKKRKHDDEQRSELAVGGDKNMVGDGNLVEKLRDYGDGAEFGEDEKRKKKKKDKRKEEDNAKEELQQLKDRKEQHKKEKKKHDRRED